MQRHFLRYRTLRCCSMRLSLATRHTHSMNGHDALRCSTLLCSALYCGTVRVNEPPCPAVSLATRQSALWKLIDAFQCRAFHCVSMPCPALRGSWDQRTGWQNHPAKAFTLAAVLCMSLRVDTLDCTTLRCMKARARRAAFCDPSGIAKPFNRRLGLPLRAISDDVEHLHRSWDAAP